jgi:hypothetical protein
MANMKVVSEIELSVPVAEKHIEAAKSAASFLTTDQSSIQIEIEGENKNWICTSFLVKRARQMDVCDKIMREMRMDMEDYQDQTLYFPKTEAERRREQRKQERAKERRRLARFQREAGKC